MLQNINQKTDLIKLFCKDLKKIAYQKWESEHQTFSNFLEIAYCVVHNTNYHLWVFLQDEAFEKMEQKYMELITKYHEQRFDIAKMYWYLLTFYQDQQNYDDFLWNIIEEEKMTSESKGQFFTPIHVCNAMAEMIFWEQEIKEKWYFTLQEPCCWAGRMIIAMANVTKQAWYDGRTQMIFEATDIDRNCFLMTYIQTALLGLSWIVKWWDALSFKDYEAQETPMLKIIQSQENIKRVQTLQSQIKAMETIEKMQAIISDTKQIVETKINHDYEFQRQDSWLIQWVLF